jgi:AcrR family transcriptional regulator
VAVPEGRRVGRPRVDPRPTEKEPREELLDAAAELFSNVGYGHATTRAIAQAAGLRQPSLFHYFATKEELFAELLDRTVEPAMALLRRLETLNEPPDVRLYLLVYGDVRNLSSGAYNVPVLQLLPEARRPPFRNFWRKREQLFAGYLALVERTAQDGFGRVDDAERTTRTMFGAVESIATWVDRNEDDALEVATTAADLLVGGLVGFRRLDRVQAIAGQLLDAVVLSPADP